MSDTIKPTPPVYSNGPTFHRGGMRRNTIGGPSSPSSTPPGSARTHTTTTSTPKASSTTPLSSQKPSLPSLNLPKASPSSLSSIKEPVPPSAPASYRPPRTSILTERSVRGNGITTAHRKSMPPLYSTSLESLGSQTARPPATTSSGGEEEEEEEVESEVCFDENGQEGDEAVRFEEIWIQVDNNNEESDDIKQDFKLTISSPRSGDLPPPSTRGSEVIEMEHSADIPETSDFVVPATTVTIEIPATNLNNIQLNDTPSEVITFSETVTLSGSNNLPDPATPKYSYPIPPIIPQKQDDKPAEQPHHKMPNYALPPGIIKSTFSVLRTKSGDIIPRYAPDPSKSPDKPNFTISKTRNPPTGILRTTSSGELAPRPAEKGKNATSPLSKVQSIKSALLRTNSSDSFSKADKSISPAKSRDTPPKSAPLHRTKSSENINKLTEGDKPKMEENGKVKESPLKFFQSKSRESSFTSIIRMKSSENLKNENSHKRSLSDASAQKYVTKSETDVKKEEDKPKSGDRDDAKPKSPYIYPKPAHHKSPSKSPVSLSPPTSPRSPRSPTSRSPTSKSNSKSPSKSPNPEDKPPSPSKDALNKTTAPQKPQTARPLFSLSKETKTKRTYSFTSGSTPSTGATTSPTASAVNTSTSSTSSTRSPGTPPQRTAGSTASAASSGSTASPRTNIVTPRGSSMTNLTTGTRFASNPNSTSSPTSASHLFPPRATDTSTFSASSSSSRVTSSTFSSTSHAHAPTSSTTTPRTGASATTSLHTTPRGAPSSSSSSSATTKPPLPTSSSTSSLFSAHHPPLSSHPSSAHSSSHLTSHVPSSSHSSSTSSLPKESSRPTPRPSTESPTSTTSSSSSSTSTPTPRPHNWHELGLTNKLKSIPISPANALKNHLHELTQYECGEILDYPQVCFLGNSAGKVRSTASTNNYGFDDERGDYMIVLHDHLAYRYEIISVLGKGSFGQVVKAYDYKLNAMVAAKIIRNKKRFHHQALIEVKILEHLKENDPNGTANIIHMSEYFYFRNHLCITFELLSINLYEFIKANKFQGFSLGLIRRFGIQLLYSLRFLAKRRIIHADLKPENILLKQPTKSGIKVIDFGSSCFENETVYTYIQSRFYRSPEIILGLPYGKSIDMWSLGCILAELYTGYPLFPGENEAEQLLCIMETMGLPPKAVVDNSTRKKLFFDSNSVARVVPNSRGKKRKPASKTLAQVLKCNDKLFLDFLDGCLKWDAKERMTPEEGLKHAWILEALTQPGTTGTSGTSTPNGVGSSFSTPRSAQSSTQSQAPTSSRIPLKTDTTPRFPSATTTSTTSITAPYSTLTSVSASNPSYTQRTAPTSTQSHSLVHHPYGASTTTTNPITHVSTTHHSNGTRTSTTLVTPPTSITTSSKPHPELTSSSSSSNLVRSGSNGSILYTITTENSNNNNSNNNNTTNNSNLNNNNNNSRSTSSSSSGSSSSNLSFAGPLAANNPNALVHSSSFGSNSSSSSSGNTPKARLPPILGELSRMKEDMVTPSKNTGN
eukprot:Phypoly_transcript_00455.p1 GENE.Phypoly_transcript_00455~~Phypoly_transcript_00455.p1  ORF type:complete len:1517 (+),score=378.84 Phypoly_transcript_00455:142-4692(+)